MSAYTVATAPDGTRVWYAGWQMPGGLGTVYKDSRPATPQEAAIMEKVVWRRDDARDLKQLRELLSADRIAPVLE